MRGCCCCWQTRACCCCCCWQLCYEGGGRDSYICERKGSSFCELRGSLCQEKSGCCCFERSGCCCCCERRGCCCWLICALYCLNVNNCLILNSLMLNNYLSLGCLVCCPLFLELYVKKVTRSVLLYRHSNLRQDTFVLAWPMAIPLLSIP